MTCRTQMDTMREVSPLEGPGRSKAPVVPLSRPMILVVDDDPEIRSMLERALMPICDVMAAESGLDAIRLLQTHAFALVLLDLHMPLVDGFTILKTLRRSRPNRDTEVFVVSADVAPETQAKVMRLGASTAISKPFRPVVVRTLVENRLTKLGKPACSVRPAR